MLNQTEKEVVYMTCAKELFLKLLVSVEANDAAMRGQFDEAIHLFTEAIKLDPTKVR